MIGLKCRDCQCSSCKKHYHSCNPCDKCTGDKPKHIKNSLLKRCGKYTMEWQGL